MSQQKRVLTTWMHDEATEVTFKVKVIPGRIEHYYSWCSEHGATGQLTHRKKEANKDMGSHMHSQHAWMVDSQKVKRA